MKLVPFLVSNMHCTARTLCNDWRNEIETSLSVLVNRQMFCRVFDHTGLGVWFRGVFLLFILYNFFSFCTFLHFVILMNYYFWLVVISVVTIFNFCWNLRLRVSSLWAVFWLRPCRVHTRGYSFLSQVSPSFDLLISFLRRFLALPSHCVTALYYGFLPFHHLQIIFRTGCFWWRQIRSCVFVPATYSRCFRVSTYEWGAWPASCFPSFPLLSLKVAALGPVPLTVFLIFPGRVVTVSALSVLPTVEVQNPIPDEVIQVLNL